MHGAASCQALLARGELGVEGCHKSSRARQSIHLSFRMDPKTFLSGLSEQFSPALTPLTCFIFTLWLPAGSKYSSLGRSAHPPTSPTHIGAPKKVQKSPCAFGVCWLEWAPHAPSTHSPSRGSLQSHRNTWSCWLELVWCSPCSSGMGWTEPSRAGDPPSVSDHPFLLQCVLPTHVSLRPEMWLDCVTLGFIPSGSPDALSTSEQEPHIWLAKARPRLALWM